MRSGVSSELIIAEALIYFFQQHFSHTKWGVCAQGERDRGGFWCARRMKERNEPLAYATLQITLYHSISLPARVMVFFVFNEWSCVRKGEKQRSGAVAYVHCSRAEKMQSSHIPGLSSHLFPLAWVRLRLSAFCTPSLSAFHASFTDRLKKVLSLCLWWSILFDKLKIFGELLVY